MTIWVILNKWIFLQTERLPGWRGSKKKRVSEGVPGNHKEGMKPYCPVQSPNRSVLRGGVTVQQGHPYIEI